MTKPAWAPTRLADNRHGQGPPEPPTLVATPSATPLTVSRRILSISLTSVGFLSLTQAITLGLALGVLYSRSHDRCLFAGNDGSRILNKDMLSK